MMIIEAQNMYTNLYQKRVSWLRTLCTDSFLKYIFKSAHKDDFLIHLQNWCSSTRFKNSFDIISWNIQE